LIRFVWLQYDSQFWKRLWSRLLRSLRNAYRATGGDVAGLLASSDAGRKLAGLSRVLAPALEETTAA